MKSREDFDIAKVKNINKTKKKLDSARRSRIQQIKDTINTNSSNEDLLNLEQIIVNESKNKLDTATSAPVLS